MAENARVGSIEAIEAFRSALITYLGKARPAVQEASSDLQRTLLWLETEQRLYWEQQVRRRGRDLEEAEQALLSARLSAFRDAVSQEQAAVHRARQSLEQARAKLAAVRRWSREFQPRTETEARQVEALDAILAQDLTLAVASLTETLRLLDAYTATRPEPPTAV